MIALKVAAFLAALGLATWVIGLAFQRPVLVVLGGIIVVGLGAGVMTQGLGYKAGETQETVAANTTNVSYTYDTVDPADKFPMATVMMILGAIGVFHGLEGYG